MTAKDFDEYLVSIGGLINGNYPDRGNIFSYGYCECDEGWSEMIKNCLEEMIAAGWNKEICQIKEKFGTLRVYINSASEEVYDIIYKYEEISSRTCEICGKSGKIRGGSWVRTLCDEHYTPKS